MARYGGAMRASMKGPGNPSTGSGSSRGTVPIGAANTPRAGAANTKAAGGTPPATPFTGIWGPLIGRRPSNT